MANVSYEENVLPYLAAVEGWTRDGLNAEQIAHNLGVGYSTFKRYAKLHEELKERLKKGLVYANFEVENSLFKRAVGYKYTEIIKERRNGQLGVTKEIVKEVSPDVTAQIFWLKNKLPDMWRDRKEMLNENKNVTLEEFLRKLGDELPENDDPCIE